MKTILEQIVDLKATLAQKMEAINEINQKTFSEGRTKDANEREEFDNLKSEIKSLKDEIADLEEMSELNKAAAKPVQNETKAAYREPATVKRTEKLEPGIAFAQVARVKALAKQDGESPRTVARELYGESSLVYSTFSKAAVPAGTTQEGNWAYWMTGDNGQVYADFLDVLRPATILGQFGTNGIPSLMTVPAGVAIGIATGEGEGYWVGEGKAKPLTNFTGTNDKLNLMKVANIAVVTEELLRRSGIAADRMLRDKLVSALARRLDIDFITISKGATATSPASITNGVTPVASAGGTADDIRTDIKNLFGKFISANNAPSNGVWIMSSTAALGLSLMTNPLGQPEFPGLNMRGGTFAGLPVIVSDYVPAGQVTLVNASDVWVTEEGGVQVDVSNQASLEMSDTPTHSSDTPTGTSLVSMWQTNSVAFRAERHINWKRGRDSGVQLITNAAWAGYVAP